MDFIGDLPAFLGAIVVIVLILWAIVSFLLPFFVISINGKIRDLVELQEKCYKELRDIEVSTKELREDE